MKLFFICDAWNYFRELNREQELKQLTKSKSHILALIFLHFVRFESSKLTMSAFERSAVDTEKKQKKVYRFWSEHDSGIHQTFSQIKCLRFKIQVLFRVNSFVFEQFKQALTMPHIECHYDRAWNFFNYCLFFIRKMNRLFVCVFVGR